MALSRAFRRAVANSAATPSAPAAPAYRLATSSPALPRVEPVGQSAVEQHAHLCARRLRHCEAASALFDARATHMLPAAEHEAVIQALLHMKANLQVDQSAQHEGETE